MIASPCAVGLRSLSRIQDLRVNLHVTILPKKMAADGTTFKALDDGGNRANDRQKQTLDDAYKALPRSNFSHLRKFRRYMQCIHEEIC
mmetsp:Transcript_22925/g.29269  ORF Transcript_22925/g.29269 Transcript_22925/m.29269 type:complete len:88 (+) Transcript_22925:192-455(+)